MYNSQGRISYLIVIVPIQVLSIQNATRYSTELEGHALWLVGESTIMCPCIRSECRRGRRPAPVVPFPNASERRVHPAVSRCCGPQYFRTHLRCRTVAGITALLSRLLLYFCLEIGTPSYILSFLHSQQRSLYHHSSASTILSRVEEEQTPSRLTYQLRTNSLSTEAERYQKCDSAGSSADRRFFVNRN